MKLLQQCMALSLCWSLVMVGGRDAFALGADASISQPPPQAVQESPDQLQQLVAPIALYPDTLIAQILAAATYPEQVVDAERWIEQHKDLQGTPLGQEVDKQSWDPSVKAMTQFPAVLANMSQNLAWTSELGDAHLNQQQDLTQAIQVMRQKAKEAGNLNTTHQEKVKTKGQTIVIEPAATDVVTYPNTIPGWSTGIRWQSSQAGIRIRDFFWTAPESLLGWVLGLDFLAASAGVGTTGDTIGTTAVELTTTTTVTSRTAGPSLTGIASIRREETSTVRPIFTAAALAGMRVLVAPTRTQGVACVPARLAGSAMAGLREAIPSEGNPVLEAFTVGASEVAEASTVAGAGDSSYTGENTMKQEMMNTHSRSIQQLSGRVQSGILPFAILAMWAANSPDSLLAQESAQLTFPSAAEASQSLFQAVQGNDVQGIEKILGGTSELASSQDDAQDKADREVFVQKYQEMHRLCREADGSMTLTIGAENWPFPVPLVVNNGKWRFDSMAGAKEVTFRRIGNNEVTAIAICHEFVAAEKQYRANPTPPDLTVNSITSLIAKVAEGSAAGDRVLSDGYYFHSLATNSAGQFALVAYPAEYRSSGVMTFIVTSKDVVYEKDLGTNTVAAAGAMTAFHKDSSWRVADH
jgi:hypothetical protein